MASDVLITPASGLIQFSSSAGSGSGQIKIDGDDLVISNVLGDVLLGDGASDVFIGNGTDNVDIVFEQNGEIRDDASGKSITLGSKTTNILISGSNTIAMQKGGGNVGIGKTAATKTLEVEGDISGSGTGSFGNLISTTIEGTLADSSRTDINSILATDLVLGEDAQTKIDFETANEIHFYANNVEQVYVADNIFGPQSDSDVDLGASGVRWKDSYFDTVTTRNLTTTGPTTIGDGNDVIQFNPRILVEGDISASGDLHLTDITASGEIKADHFLATDQDDGYHFGDSSVALQRANNALEVKYSSTVAQFSNTIGLNLTGHITASNNISASGNFHTFGGVVNTDEVRSVTQTTNKLILEDDQDLATNMVSLMSINFVNIISDSNNNGTGKVRILDGNSDVDSATEVAEFSPEAIELHAPITASGDISASGTIKAATLDAAAVTDGLAAAIVAEIDNDEIPIAKLAEDAITIAGSSTQLGGSITADTIAGQISADTISGNQINGGTIGSVTITALAGALSLGDNNITNVGDINADSISVDAAGTGLNIDFSGGDTTKNKITLQDDLADALNITEGSNSYIKFTTTDSSEKILVSKDTDFLGNVSGSGTSTGSFGRVEAANIGDVSLSGATLFGTGLKLGRDSTDLIDFASADNTIRFRVNNSDEMNLVSDSLKPHSNDGLALGASNRQWSDLFLAEGAVINFDNGDVTLTQTNNVLAVAGTTDTTFVGNISASGNLDVKHRLFDTGSTQLGAVGGGIGDVINIGDTSTVPGAIYQLQGGGTWALTDADAAASASGSIAVALGANSTTNGMLLRGLSKLNHDPGGLAGAPVYLAVAAGSSSNAVPSGNGDIARVVGYNIDTSGMIYFNPDNTFVEVSA